MNHLTDEELIQILEDPTSASEESQAHLKDCKICHQNQEELKEMLQVMEHSPAYEAPPSIAQGVSEAIQQEQNDQSPIQYWQIAAAVALLVVGFAVGKWSGSDQTERVIALESQVELLKEMAMVNTLQQPTASQRIQAVNQIEKSPTTRSNEVINTLIKTLNTDESPNVRYSAAQALSRYTDLQLVRLQLAKSLEIQTDPIIQITLISILTEVQEKNAVKPLQQLIESESTAPEVRKQAEIAVEILI